MKQSAFSLLRSLIKDIAVCDTPRYMLHMGESKLLDDIEVQPFCDMNLEWNKYPILGGTENLRLSYSMYLEQNFSLCHNLHLNYNVSIEPTPGSKQALSSLITLCAHFKFKDSGIKPFIILPDPGYPSYSAAAKLTHAEVLFYSSNPDRMMDEMVYLLKEHADNIAVLVICNPGNPFGNILEDSDIKKISKLSTSPIIFDECYIDLTHSNSIISPLTLISQGVINSKNIIVSHTLSKRNAMPGLRSGFICGDKMWVERWSDFNRTCGVSLPVPVSSASSILWQDTSRVTKHRKLIHMNVSIFSSYFPTLRVPEAGFFVCINVSDDTLTARLLWREQGILVMPGSFLTNKIENGGSFIRIALVYPSSVNELICMKLFNFFQNHSELLIN